MSPENPKSQRSDSKSTTPEVNNQEHSPSPSTDKAKSPAPPMQKEVKKEEVKVKQEVRQEPEGQLTITRIREEPKVPVVGTTSMSFFIYFELVFIFNFLISFLFVCAEGCVV